MLKYFDAFIIGLTATPSKQTIEFFDKNLVMEYSHEDEPTEEQMDAAEQDLIRKAVKPFYDPKLET